MRIKFIKVHPLYAYFVGNEAELNAEHTEILLKSGCVVPVKSEPETAIAPKAQTATVKTEPAKKGKK